MWRPVSLTALLRAGLRLHEQHPLGEQAWALLLLDLRAPRTQLSEETASPTLGLLLSLHPTTGDLSPLRRCQRPLSSRLLLAQDPIVYPTSAHTREDSAPRPSAVVPPQALTWASQTLHGSQPHHLSSLTTKSHPPTTSQPRAPVRPDVLAAAQSYQRGRRCSALHARHLKTLFKNTAGLNPALLLLHNHTWAAQSAGEKPNSWLTISLPIHSPHPAAGSPHSTHSPSFDSLSFTGMTVSHLLLTLKPPAPLAPPHSPLLIIILFQGEIKENVSVLLPTHPRLSPYSVLPSPQRRSCHCPI